MRLAIAYFLSGVVHIGALSWFSGMADRLPEALPTTQGRASVKLVSSSAAAPRHDPDDDFERLREAVLTENRDRQTASPPELEPGPIEIPKRDFEILASQAAVDRFDVTVSPPPAAPKHELADDEFAESPLKRKAVHKKPDDLASLADRAAVDSVGSEAFNGTEFDDLPRKAAANTPPPYPEDAYREGRQGTVQLRVSITAVGTVSAISVYKSSGVASLDKSALTTVRSWRFQPALRRGVAVAMDAIVPIRYTIRGGGKPETSASGE